VIPPDWKSGAFTSVRVRLYGAKYICELGFELERLLVRQSSRALNCGLICGQSTDKNLSGFDPALINSEQWQISSSDSQRASK